MSEPHDWFVSAALKGNGARAYPGAPRQFVFYVQRYTPESASRFTGEILTQTFDAEEDATDLCAALNADPERPYSARATYL